jgi:hypothetical protein
VIALANMDTNDKRICLIGGSGRSGTTILTKIFKKHSKVAVAPEWRFLVDPDGILDYVFNSHRWSPYHVDVRYKRLKKLLLAVADISYSQKLLNKLAKKGAFARLKRKLLPRYSAISASRVSPNYLEFVEHLFDELSAVQFNGYWVGTPFLAEKQMYYTGVPDKDELLKIFRKFIYSIIDDVKEAQDAEYYVEKNTWNILWYDEIRELLPQSKLVHVYRDPRDVVSSFSSQTWMPADVRNSALIYKSLLDRWDSIKGKVPQNSFLEVSLENLVRKPEQVLKNICSFWNLPWEDNLLNIDLSRSHSGRWKKQLNKDQQLEVKNILKDNLERLGYE